MRFYDGPSLGVYISENVNRVPRAFLALAQRSGSTLLCCFEPSKKLPESLGKSHLSIAFSCDYKIFFFCIFVQGDDVETIGIVPTTDVDQMCVGLIPCNEFFCIKI